jgi:tRNA dimethylallyltransferase
MLIGCTGGGKARVGLELARRMDGEIVSVDSMKIYRRMDIGTAKPSADVRADVPHHLIDVVEPSESFGLGRYIEQASDAIREIDSCGQPVLAVGGTMLYVMGLIRGVFEGPSSDAAFRRELRDRAEREGTEALHAELARVDPAAADRIHRNDLRRIERALEVFHTTGSPISELQQQWESTERPFDVRVVGLRREKGDANHRINMRVKRMIDRGLVDEVRRLMDEPDGIGEQAAQAVGYAELIAFHKGECSLEDAIERIKMNSRRLAKHQRTWMRRMPEVTHVDVAESESATETADRVQAVWTPA